MADERYFNRGLGLKDVVGGRVARDYRGPIVELMRGRGFRLDVGDLVFRLPKEFGFCYGVDRAIEYAYEAREKFPHKRVFITGEVIHNSGVNRRLEEMDIHFLDGRHDCSYDDVRYDDVVIVPAFGVPAKEMEQLRRIGCVVVDTTCGSVLNVWKNVRRYAKTGFTSLIHGKYWHEETRATASQAIEQGGHYLVVLNMDEAKLVCDTIEGKVDREAFLERFAQAVSPGFDPDAQLERLGCANQTTMLSTESLAIAGEIRQAMVRRWGEERIARRFLAFDTICTATQDRQDALRELLEDEKIDLMLIVGGYNSSNTGHLLEIAGEKIPAYHILDASCIEGTDAIRHQPAGATSETRAADWLPAGPVTVGVTSGASTPDGEVDAVIRRVASLRGHRLD